MIYYVKEKSSMEYHIIEMEYVGILIADNISFYERSKEKSNLMAFIKNIEHETALSLKEEVQVQPGQVVSKTLAQNKAVSVTLFAFSKGEEISSHDSEGDAMVTVLEGVGKLTVGGKEHIVTAGETLIMPAKIPHAVYAEEDFKMMLTVVFPER